MRYTDYRGFYFPSHHNQILSLHRNNGEGEVTEK